MLKDKHYEVVGIFSSVEELDQAVDELFIYGFDQSYLSVLAHEDSIKQKLKKKYRKIDELMDASNIPKSEFYAEENFSIAQGVVIGSLIYIGGVITIIKMIKGSTIFSALAIIGTFLTLGILLARAIRNYHKDYLEQQIRKGGLILWVSIKDKLLKKTVIKVLKHNRARNVHLRARDDYKL